MLLADFAQQSREKDHDQDAPKWPSSLYGWTGNHKSQRENWGSLLSGPMACMDQRQRDSSSNKWQERME